MAVPPPTLWNDKRALRARMRVLRDAFVTRDHAAILPPHRFLDLLESGMTIASYIPIGSEADPAALTLAAGERGCALALPHVTGRDDSLRFLAWNPGEALIEGPFGLMQPIHHADEVSPDMILTPMVAFDRAHNRLGQGAGHYDRAFAALPDATRIGVAWSVQQVDTLPADPWDVPLHAVITERGWQDAAA